MFIGIYVSHMDEQYVSKGFTITEVIDDLESQLGDSIAIKDILFFSAKQIKVKTEFIIEE